jgi:hypothetical protein
MEIACLDRNSRLHREQSRVLEVIIIEPLRIFRLAQCQRSQWSASRGKKGCYKQGSRLGQL